MDSFSLSGVSSSLSIASAKALTSLSALLKVVRAALRPLIESTSASSLDWQAKYQATSGFMVTSSKRVGRP